MVSFCLSVSCFVPLLFVFVSVSFCMVLMVNVWLTVVERCSVDGVACCWPLRCVAFCFCFCMGTLRAWAFGSLLLLGRPRCVAMLYDYGRRPPFVLTTPLTTLRVVSYRPRLTAAPMVEASEEKKGGIFPALCGPLSGPVDW